MGWDLPSLFVRLALTDNAAKFSGFGFLRGNKGRLKNLGSGAPPSVTVDKETSWSSV